jgi:GNAT superfamily N-acetyltransferase
MQCRILRPDDYAAFDAFLVPHMPWVYFMRANSHLAGLTFANQPYQAEYFAAWNDAAELCGVLAHSWLGGVQCFVPEPKAVVPLVESLCAAQRQNPRAITVLLGPAAHVAHVMRVMRIQPAMLRAHDEQDALYTLELSALQRAPLAANPAITLRRAVAADMPTLTRWMYEFNLEALQDPADAATQAKAEEAMNRQQQACELFVLEKAGALLSFCGAGGALSDWKKIGPVWTPPEQRGHGYAKAVVSGALQQLRQEGATKAWLSASDPAAIRVYQAVGFQALGEFSLHFLREPLVPLRVA